MTDKGRKLRNATDAPNTSGEDASMGSPAGRGRRNGSKFEIFMTAVGIIITIFLGVMTILMNNLTTTVGDIREDVGALKRSDEFRTTQIAQIQTQIAQLQTAPVESGNLLTPNSTPSPVSTIYFLYRVSSHQNNNTFLRKSGKVVLNKRLMYR